MTIADFKFDRDAMLKAIRSDVHSDANQPDCDYYFVPFGNHAEELGTSHDAAIVNAFRFLGAICALKINPDDLHCPFVSQFASDLARTPVLDAIADEQVVILSEIVAEIDDAELLARVADIVWVRKKDHEIARIAVGAYCDSATRLLATEFSSGALVRFERALQIAASLGITDQVFEKTRQIIEGAALKTDIRHYLVCGCLDILLKFPTERSEKFAQLCETLAASKEVSDKPLWQRRFWVLAANWHKRTKNNDAVRSAQIEVARTFEQEADIAQAEENAPSALIASHFLEQAIQAYRKVEGTESERELLHKKLLACQKKAVKEIPSHFSDSVDLSELAQRSRDKVRGKNILDSLRCLALAFPVPSKSKLKKAAETNVVDFPLTFLFPATTLSREGKVVASQEAMSSKSPDYKKSMIRWQMYSQAKTQHDLYVVGIIEPMRKQIVVDSYIRYQDILPIVTYSSFIPPGREELFLLGLHAGLHGKLVEAAHVLIPQVEHAIREILESHDVITSGVNADGIQMERDLNSLLYEDKLEEIMGDDIVFDLRGLLVEHCSANFRNQLAHGLLEVGAFHDTTALYIWWLVLRLCMLGCLPRPEEADGMQDNSNEVPLPK